MGVLWSWWCCRMVLPRQHPTPRSSVRPLADKIPSHYVCNAYLWLMVEPGDNHGRKRKRGAGRQCRPQPFITKKKKKKSEMAHHWPRILRERGPRSRLRGPDRIRSPLACCCFCPKSRRSGSVEFWQKRERKLENLRWARTPLKKRWGWRGGGENTGYQVRTKGHQKATTLYQGTANTASSCMCS
jgi:hypothetical protein